MEIPSELVTKQELEQYLRVSRTSVERLLEDRTIRAYRAGRRNLRFNLRDVMNAIAIGKVD